VAGLNTVAVPVKAPVLTFMLNPAGKAGLTVYEITAPPPTVGVCAVIATDFVAVSVLEGYTRLMGA